MFTVSFFDNSDLESRVLAVGVDAETAAETAYKAGLAWFPSIVRDFLLNTVAVSRRDLASKASALEFLKSTFGTSPENFLFFWSNLTQWCIKTSDLPDDFTAQSKYPGDFHILDTASVTELDFDAESSL
jgi:hypothetical protein